MRGSIRGIRCASPEIMNLARWGWRVLPIGCPVRYLKSSGGVLAGTVSCITRLCSGQMDREYRMRTAANEAIESIRCDRHATGSAYPLNARPHFGPFHSRMRKSLSLPRGSRASWFKGVAGVHQQYHTFGTDPVIEITKGTANTQFSCLSVI
jgi:hypothetical protein